eukprot:INCI10956.1.p2 GENE.INCI10956.1~~INCI10956.1.p2  ORF type:complete len:123 (+),score=10.78 INCI10956.1:276-644(+)
MFLLVVCCRSLLLGWLLAVSSSRPLLPPSFNQLFCEVSRRQQAADVCSTALRVPCERVGGSRVCAKGDARPPSAFKSPTLCKEVPALLRSHERALVFPFDCYYYFYFYCYYYYTGLFTRGAR